MTTFPFMSESRTNVPSNDCSSKAVAAVPGATRAILSVVKGSPAHAWPVVMHTTTAARMKVLENPVSIIVPITSPPDYRTGSAVTFTDGAVTVCITIL